MKKHPKTARNRETIDKYFPEVFAQKIRAGTRFRELCGLMTGHIQRATLLGFLSNRTIRETYVTDEGGWRLIPASEVYNRAYLVFVLSIWLTGDILNIRTARTVERDQMFRLANAIVSTINALVEQAVMPAFRNGMPELVDEQFIDGALLEELPLSPVAELFRDYSNGQISIYLDQVVALLRGCDSPMAHAFVMFFIEAAGEHVTLARWMPDANTFGGPAGLYFPDQKIAVVFHPYTIGNQLLDVVFADEQIADWDILHICQNENQAHARDVIQRKVIQPLEPNVTAS